MNNVILIPHIKVHNANALSSPYTVGFPAMTAWLGAIHALQRNINKAYPAVKFNRVGVVSHDFNLQTYKGPGDFVHSIIGTGNPLEPKTEKGKPIGNAVRPSFIEEARCHLEVSLIVQFDHIKAIDEESILRLAASHLHATLKIAGGDIFSFQPLEIIRDFPTLKRKLMPGYAIIERKELIEEGMRNGQDALDAILDFLAVHHTCDQTTNDETNNVVWQSKRKSTAEGESPGWLVPIATGFQGVTNLAAALNQRCPETPHRFAEAIITLGEFKMPYKLQILDELMWSYKYLEEESLYLCTQDAEPQIHDDEYDY